MKEQVFDNYSGTLFFFSDDTFVSTLGKVIFCGASSSSEVGAVCHDVAAAEVEEATATAKTALS